MTLEEQIKVANTKIKELRKVIDMQIDTIEALNKKNASLQRQLNHLRSLKK